MTQWLNTLLLQVAQMGGWGMVLFILVYIVVAVTMVPAFPFTVAAGAIYGVTRGSLVVLISAVLGGSLAYWVAVSLAGTRWMERFDHDTRVVTIRNAIGSNSIWIQFLLRLSPIVPFTVLNYALGLARVRFKDFVIALIGMIPTIILYTYYGKVVGDVTAIAAGTTAPRGPAYYGLVVLGLATTVLASYMIARAARRALKESHGL